MLGENNIIEINENFNGSLKKNKHNGQKLSDDWSHLRKDSKPYKPKKAVNGFIERNGNIVLQIE